MSICFAVVLLMGSCISNTVQAQIIKPQGEVNASITMENAINKANVVASNEGYDFSRLSLLETKANLVYSEEDDAYEWIVSYIVEDEADPYLLTTIDALTGTVLSIAKTNYFELCDQWELQRQLPHDLWSMEELVLFDTLYRRSDYLPRYTFPTERDLSKEVAIQVSREVLCDKFDLLNASLDKYECSATLRQDIGNQRKCYHNPPISLKLLKAPHKAFLLILLKIKTRPALSMASIDKASRFLVCESGRERSVQDGEWHYCFLIRFSTAPTHACSGSLER